MSSLEQRTKDRDRARAGGRVVTPRAAGVSTDTWLAETAQTVQTSRTSMKWASARARAVPAQTAQTAETRLRSADQAIKMWWSHSGGLEKTRLPKSPKIAVPPSGPTTPCGSVSPDRKTGCQPTFKINPWGIDLTGNTSEMKTATEISEIPKFRRPLSLVWYAPQVQQRLIAGSAALRAAHGLCSR